MPFIFAAAPHSRKHGPGGYTQYQTYKDWLRDEFTFLCGIGAMTHDEARAANALAHEVSFVEPIGSRV